MTHLHWARICVNFPPIHFLLKASARRICLLPLDLEMNCPLGLQATCGQKPKSFSRANWPGFWWAKWVLVWAPTIRAKSHKSIKLERICCCCPIFCAAAALCGFLGRKVCCGPFGGIWFGLYLLRSKASIVHIYKSHLSGFEGIATFLA